MPSSLNPQWDDSPARRGLALDRAGVVRGGEVAGNGMPLSSSPTLGPCGHSHRRRLVV